MRIVIAPDKYKGSLSAAHVAQSIANGVRAVLPNATIDLCPMSDGGEGFVEALVTATGGRSVSARITGPLPELKVIARYGFLGTGDLSTTAVIEMASASGLALLSPDQYDPFATTTFGTGELIAHAIRQGAKEILLGIGGSATVDAGIGAAQACGFTVLMRDGAAISPTEPLCGRDVPDVLMVKHGRGEVTNGIPITVACDVTNPLYGPLGAARVYGPQKGATEEQIQILDKAFASLTIRMGVESLAQSPGAGAAGGLGFGMLAFFGATLKNGFEIVAQATGLLDRIRNADLIITGEGRFDASSMHGKVVARVANVARTSQIPCLAVCGDREQGLQDDRLASLTALTDVVSKEIALSNTEQQLTARTATAVRRWMDNSRKP